MGGDLAYTVMYCHHCHSNVSSFKLSSSLHTDEYFVELFSNSSTTKHQLRLDWRVTKHAYLKLHKNIGPISVVGTIFIDTYLHMHTRKNITSRHGMADGREYHIITQFTKYWYY
jgi:hypothetical protein